MHGNFSRENREVPSTPDTQLCAGRLEKDMIQKSNMHVDGKSDGRAVPTKCLNKSGNPLTEGMEGRRPAEENTEQTTASQTQSWGDALSGLRGVREAAKRDKRLQFTALLHHVSVLLLESSFYALKRDAAPGVDGVHVAGIRDGPERTTEGLTQPRASRNVSSATFEESLHS